MAKIKDLFQRFEWWVVNLEPGWLGVIIVDGLVILFSLAIALAVGYVFHLSPFN